MRRLAPVNHSRTYNFRRLIFSMAIVFVIFLTLLEVVIGYFFIDHFSSAIEQKRKEEFVYSWRQFIEQRKRNHESKITGYAWWRDMANAFINKNYAAVQNELFGPDSSLRNDYDVFLSVAGDGTMVFGAIDDVTSLEDKPAFDKKRNIALEKDFLKKTADAFADYKKKFGYRYLYENNRKSLVTPIVWHIVTEFAGEPRLLSFTTISADTGYPLTEGFIAFGKKVESITKAAGQIIPAELFLRTEKPDKTEDHRGYLRTQLKGYHDHENYVIEFKPNLSARELASGGLYLFIGVQIVLSIFVFLVVIPYFTRRHTYKLHEIIEAQTDSLKKANFKLKNRHNEIDRELRLASVVQKSSLPPVEFSTNHVHIHVFYEPMARLGGDIYEMRDLGNQKTAVLIADVVGHGVPAALISMMARTVFTANSGAGIAPHETFEAMNRTMRQYLTLGDFLSAFYLIIDEKTKQYHFSNAGHREGLLFPGNNEKPQLITTEGPVLGVVENARYITQTSAMSDDDKIVLITDGVVEQTNSTGEDFGNERLIDLLAKNVHRSSGEMVEVLVAELEKFRSGRHYRDDVTVIGVDIKLND